MDVIDLHGIKHSDVSRVLDEFIWEGMKKKEKVVEVITGKSDQMKRIVTELTSEYNLDCYEDSKNEGKIIIKLV
jgi:DNA-nicking Smr family endonuclease